MIQNTREVYACVDDASIVKLYANVTIEYRADKYNDEILEYNLLKIENVSLSITVGDAEQQVSLTKELRDSMVKRFEDELIDAFFEDFQFYNVTRKMRERG